MDLFDLTPEVLRDLRVDSIVNLAFVHKGESSVQTTDEAWKSNVLGAQHVVELAAHRRVPVIMFSTREVLGYVMGSDDVHIDPDSGRLIPKWLPSEDALVLPRSNYGKTKLMGEWLTTSYTLGYALRLATPYANEAWSPEDSAKGLVASLIRNARTSTIMNLPNDGMPFRDPVHIYDVASLCQNIFNKRPEPGVFNCGYAGDNLISFREIVQTVNSKIRIESTATEDYGFAFDCSKAQSLLDWVPRIGIRQWLKDGPASSL
jgi:nucleoside-diphosphate-sugar epimerase